jgi:hypothetical protein
LLVIFIICEYRVEKKTPKTLKTQILKYFFPFHSKQIKIYLDRTNLIDLKVAPPPPILVPMLPSSLMEN